MKPLHLNLAAKPYRDYRPIWVVVGILSLLTLVLLVNNIRTAYRFFVNTRDTRVEIARVERATNTEKEKAEKIADEITRLDTRRLETRVEFVNEQIAERAFSWSGLLDNLEKVVPDDVRLVTLAPTVTADGPVTLNMTCISRTDGGLVEMIRALNADEHFSNPFPTSESLMEGGAHQFVLSVTYQVSAKAEAK